MKPLISLACAAAVFGAAQARAAEPGYAVTLAAVCRPLIEKKSVIFGVTAAQKLGYEVKAVRNRGEPLETVVLKGPLGRLDLSAFEGGDCTLRAPTDRYRALLAEFDAWAAKAPGGPYAKGKVGPDEAFHRFASWKGQLGAVSMTEDPDDDDPNEAIILIISFEAPRKS